METYTDYEKTPTGKTVESVLWDCEKCGEVTLTKPEDNPIIVSCGCRKSSIDVEPYNIKKYGYTRILKIYKK